MRYLVKFISVILFSFFFFSSSMSEEKTAFIDVDFLLQNSNIGKKILKNINDFNKKNIDQLEKKNNDLKNHEINTKNKKNIISEQEFKKEINNFQEKVKLFNEEKNNMVTEFNNYRNTEIEKVFKVFNPIISNYMKKNSIKILFDSKNIFMGSQNSNITKEILEIINNEIK